MKWLIIGRTVTRNSGCSFHWKDVNGVLPNEDELVWLRGDMARVHRETFGGHNPERVAVVFLPSMGRLDSPGKMPRWSDGTEEGRHGIWLNDMEDEEYFWPERSQHAEA